MSEDHENGIILSSEELAQESLTVIEEPEDMYGDCEDVAQASVGTAVLDSNLEADDEVKQPFYKKLIEPEYRWRTIWVGILVVAIILLVFPIASFASNPETYTGTIATLDEKKNNVLGLSVSTVGVATLASAIPLSNAGTPIANALMNMNSNLLIILAVIYMEKFLVTTFALVGCRFLIPAALACFVVTLVAFGHERVATVAKQIGKKLLIIGLAISLVIPVSVFVTDLIDSTYATNIEASNQAAQQASEMLEDEIQEESTIEDSKDEKPWWEQVGQGISDGVNGIASAASTAATGALDSAKQFLTSTIDTVAIMIVTSCIVPILVLALFIWLLNSVIGMKVETPLKSRNHTFFSDKSKNGKGKTAKSKAKAKK